MAERTILCLALCAAVTAPAASEPKRPNIVILLADDLGWADVGYHGSVIKTPHIDRLAREGVRCYLSQVSGLFRSNYRHSTPVSEAVQGTPGASAGNCCCPLANS